MNIDLTIDKAAVVDAAAEKVAAQLLAEHANIYDHVTERLDAEIAKILTSEVQARLKDRIDAELTAACNSVLERQFVPVDMWGEAAGAPTTIREQLHDRALKFWEMRVEKTSDGRVRETNYGGQPRHQLLYKDVVTEAFEQAIKAQVSEIVTAFKQAVAKDAGTLIAKHIEALIPNRAAR